MQDLSLRYIKGIGSKLANTLAKLEIYSGKDLLYYFPLRYQDRRYITPIKEIKEGVHFLVKGKVMARNVRGVKRFLFGRKLFEAVVSDGSGFLNCVWFNQPYLRDYINVGDELFLYGKATLFKGSIQFISPEYEKFSSVDSFNFGRIVGFYRLVEGITQRRMRKIIFEGLKKFSSQLLDPLPFYIREERKIPNIREALENIHYPSTFQDANLARERFIFEELFFSQIMVYLRKARRVLTKGIPFKVDKDFIEEIRRRFDFSLTSSQEEALVQILEDMKKPYPMHRLLQGDVGSGKTAVAIFAIGVCVHSGYQAAVMVPTEILAFQHHQALQSILAPLGFRVDILVSSLSKKMREKIITSLKEGKTEIVVGTHSLLDENVEFKNLGLVVIDEQHKFGVAQRALLPKKGKNPDCLIMSATPIPRSLALSIYGDLDLSLIKELPPNRCQPQTIVVDQGNREWVYSFIKDKLKEGRQAYIIYPVIEESRLQDIHSLNQMYERLKKVFTQFRVEVFHGQMSKKRRLEIAEDFRKNRINILVATTVVEVGINIENATVMVVENPERFGLSQLHQLRGRIRRSTYQPYFIVIGSENMGENARKRIEVIKETSDGFKIAEEDLKLRGPGDFFGHLQWGFPHLKVANPLEDLDNLRWARKLAYQVVKNDPHLRKPYHRCIKEHLDFWIGK
ncbi:MAG: DNA helicase RecG [Candidatus Omnitrophota bacterium]|nr:MAG: DNA helicase RecG [Candidatus Omnitrophota bacterium]HDN86519.1 ATP-dependent DNA helicase RecG [Candidatus Omnitrophota bacterium]